MIYPSHSKYALREIEVELEKIIFNLIKKASTQLPDDTERALRKAYEQETNQIAKLQLKTILDNIEMAKRKQLPICQDTGTLMFFVDVGVDFPYKREIRNSIYKAVEIATNVIPLRPNCVDPFTDKNTGNLGEKIPWIEWNVVEGKDCKITLLPKGGGSENCSALEMFNPSDGMEKIEDFVVNHIIECNGKPCPPVIVGIGIGGGADIAMKLAKRSLLRPVGERSKNKTIADLEERLLKRINGTGIGPMGLGGKTTALDVHIEYASRHPASFPVALSIQCWANRRASVIIKEDGDIKWI